MTPDLHKDVDYDVEEHGQKWAVCRTCGAQWSINQSNLGEQYDEVSEGDGYCEEQLAA